VEIPRTGRITAGQFTGWVVEVVPAVGSAGALSINIWPDDQSNGFDYWLESVEDLPQFLAESNWDVIWSAQS